MSLPVRSQICQSTHKEYRFLVKREDFSHVLNSSHLFASSKVQTTRLLFIKTGGRNSEKPTLPSHHQSEQNTQVWDTPPSVTTCMCVLRCLGMSLLGRTLECYSIDLRSAWWTTTKKTMDDKEDYGCWKGLQTIRKAMDTGSKQTMNFSLNRRIVFDRYKDDLFFQLGCQAFCIV